MKKLARKLKKLNLVHRKKFKLKSGAESNFYIDIKKAFGYPDIMDSICNAVWKKMEEKPTCIAGAGYGGLPLAAALAQRFNVKLALVRESPKKYGRKNWIDGYIPAVNDKVIIVDDVLTTGESLSQIIKVVKNTNAKILKCCVVVKRGESRLKVPISYVFSAEELI